MATTMIVATAQGQISPHSLHGALGYLAIPYASPPLGALRFAAPQAPPTWSGTRTSDHLPPAPLQLPGGLLGARPIAEMSEDCLYLNVYTANCSAHKPVMLWIYGGGFIAGSGSDVLTQGYRLAQQGDVVLVTFNYRLGIFGFLQSDESGCESNVGLQDQLAVLRWIQTNIEAFGGDPHNVTIFGESAGAMSVMTLTTMPVAKGLFHRAIAQSGTATAVQPREQGARVRAELLQLLGKSSISALRRLAANELLKAQGQLLDNARRSRSGMSFRPVIDGELVPAIPLQLLREGAGTPIPLMLGSNQDEQRLYLSPRQELEVDELRNRVQTRLHVDAANAQELIDLYREHRPDIRDFAEIGLWCAIETDLAFRLPVLRIARARAQRAHDRTFVYLFDWKSPGLRGWLGACHAIEIPFVFRNLDAPGMRRFAGQGEGANRLANRVSSAWCAFAHRSDPSIEQWQAFKVERSNHYRFAADGVQETPGIAPHLERLAQLSGDW